MEEVLDPLEKNAIGEALPHQKDALESLKKLAAEMEAKQKELTERSRKINSTRCAASKSKTAARPTKSAKW